MPYNMLMAFIPHSEIPFQERRKDMSKDQHVTPHPEGGWQVKGAGNEKATARTDTQQEAIDIAKNIAQNQNSELFIHGKNGQIRERNTYGNDPYPPKG